MFQTLNFDPYHYYFSPNENEFKSQNVTWLFFDGLVFQFNANTNQNIVINI